MRALHAALVAAWLAPAALAGPPSPTVPPEKAAPDIVDQALSGDGGWHDLSWWTDHIGPRLAGSAAHERAVAWSVEAFRRDGATRSWTEPVLVPHWIRGGESARIVAPTSLPIAMLGLGGSVPTPEGGVTAEVIRVTDFDELKRVGERARGRIVLYDKPIEAGFGNPNGYGSAAGLRVDGAIEAARFGALATLVRSLGTADFRLPHTGMMRYEDGVPKIPSAAISAEDADLIHRLIDAGETVRVRLEMGCRTVPDVESANVIADVAGRERPDEIVLIGCHLDSWDVGTGAIDDGAGCAIVTEALRLVAARETAPRRTVRAVLFTAEEIGGLGGKAYAERHADELSRHVAAIEVDQGAGTPLGFGVTAGEGGLATVRGIAARLEDLGAARVRDGGGGADIGWMKAAGVPMLILDQESERYFDWHHSPADTLDKVDPKALARAAAAVAWMTWSLAERDEPLPRMPADPEK